MEHAKRKQIIATDPSWLSSPERSFGSRTKAWGSIEENIDARKSFDWMQALPAPSLLQPSVVISRAGEATFYPRSTPLQGEMERAWTSVAPTFPIDLLIGNDFSLHLPEIAQAFHQI